MRLGNVARPVLDRDVARVELSRCALRLGSALAHGAEQAIEGPVEGGTEKALPPHGVHLLSNTR